MSAGAGEHAVDLRWSAATFLACAEASPTIKPSRVRVVMITADGSKMAVIRRHRPGREPYHVLPGGGIEPEDRSPEAAILREVREELGLDHERFRLRSDRVVVDQDHWIYLAEIAGEVPLAIGGPEAELSPAEHGTYQPSWLSVAESAELTLYPEFLTAMVEGI